MTVKKTIGKNIKKTKKQSGGSRRGPRGSRGSRVPHGSLRVPHGSLRVPRRSSRGSQSFSKSPTVPPSRRSHGSTVKNVQPVISRKNKPPTLHLNSVREQIEKEMSYTPGSAYNKDITNDKLAKLLSSSIKSHGNTIESVRMRLNTDNQNMAKERMGITNKNIDFKTMKLTPQLILSHLSGKSGGESIYREHQNTINQIVGRTQIKEEERTRIIKLRNLLLNPDIYKTESNA